MLKINFNDIESMTIWFEKNINKNIIEVNTQEKYIIYDEVK